MGTLANDPHEANPGQALIGQAQFDTRRANFGASLGSGSVAPASVRVPGPAALLTLLIAALALPRRRALSYAWSNLACRAGG